MSSPMMKRMFGLASWATAGAANPKAATPSARVIAPAHLAKARHFPCRVIISSFCCYRLRCLGRPLVQPSLRRTASARAVEDREHLRLEFVPYPAMVSLEHTG